MPKKMMDTWKNNHPDFEYICWTEEEIKRRNMNFVCQHRIDEMEEWCGKADIMRLEILNRYGGIYLDADSICIEPLNPDIFLVKPGFAAFENENVRKGLVANGNMGFPAGHPLVKDAIDWILKNPVSRKTTDLPAWAVTGPVLLTNMLQTGRYANEIAVFPSFTFIPMHFTGDTYMGHKRVYAHQEWGSTKQNYDAINQTLPPGLQVPKRWVSVLLPVYETTAMEYVYEAFTSIKDQTGWVGIELVVVNDGCSTTYTSKLLELIAHFEMTTRWCKVVYIGMPYNRGISVALHTGIMACSQDIVFRMDADDIMIPTRITLQLQFMDANPDAVVCGGQISCFENPDSNDPKIKRIVLNTTHPRHIHWDDYAMNTEMNSRFSWIMNHPTLCFRREAVIHVGNYREIDHFKMEDIDLLLRLMKEYKTLHNLPDILLYYRLHDKQLTTPMRSNPYFEDNAKENIQRFIDDLLVK